MSLARMLTGFVVSIRHTWVWRAVDYILDCKSVGCAKSQVLVNGTNENIVCNTKQLSRAKNYSFMTPGSDMSRGIQLTFYPIVQPEVIE